MTAEFYLCPFFFVYDGPDYSDLIGDEWMTVELYEVDGCFV